MGSFLDVSVPQLTSPASVPTDLSVTNAVRLKVNSHHISHLSLQRHPAADGVGLAGR